MKKALMFATISLIGITAIVRGGVAKPPFAIVISAENTTVRIGSPVTIMLQLTNNSNHDMNPGWWGQDNLGVMDQTDRFDVRDGRGDALLKKKRDPGFPIMGNGPTTMMTPGQTRSYAQDFNRWYDLSQPGEYSIQASRPFSENGKKGVVKSNKITITVTK